MAGDHIRRNDVLATVNDSGRFQSAAGSCVATFCKPADRSQHCRQYGSADQGGSAELTNRGEQSRGRHGSLLDRFLRQSAGRFGLL